jgi:hypothetical protein
MKTGYLFHSEDLLRIDRMIKEADLYHPLKTYLEHQGYTVSGEVKNCDIAARRDGELILVELKTRMSVSLLVQITDRKEISESVYAAVPVPPGKRSIPNQKGVIKLLKRLEAGLILVRFMKTKTKVEVILHPAEHTVRRMHRKRLAIIREIDGRYGEFTRGGIPVTEERITSYKQQAIKVAFFLKESGPLSPKELRAKGCSEKTQPILSRNFYGWFDRTGRGVYRLNRSGRKALNNYPRVIRELEKETLGE